MATRPQQPRKCTDRSSVTWCDVGVSRSFGNIYREDSCLLATPATLCLDRCHIVFAQRDDWTETHLITMKFGWQATSIPELAVRNLNYTSIFNADLVMHTC